MTAATTERPASPEFDLVYLNDFDQSDISSGAQRLSQWLKDSSTLKKEEIDEAIKTMEVALPRFQEFDKTVQIQLIQVLESVVHLEKSDAIPMSLIKAILTPKNIQDAISTVTIALSPIQEFAPKADSSVVLAQYILEICTKYPTNLDTTHQRYMESLVVYAGKNVDPQNPKNPLEKKLSDLFELNLTASQTFTTPQEDEVPFEDLDPKTGAKKALLELSEALLSNYTSLVTDKSKPSFQALLEILVDEQMAHPPSEWSRASQNLAVVSLKVLNTFFLTDLRELQQGNHTPSLESINRELDEQLVLLVESIAKKQTFNAQTKENPLLINAAASFLKSLFNFISQPHGFAVLAQRLMKGSSPIENLDPQVDEEGNPNLLFASEVLGLHIETLAKTLIGLGGETATQKYLVVNGLNMVLDFSSEGIKDAIYKRLLGMSLQEYSMLMPKIVEKIVFDRSSEQKLTLALSPLLQVPASEQKAFSAALQSELADWLHKLILDELNSSNPILKIGATKLPIKEVCQNSVRRVFEAADNPLAMKLLCLNLTKACVEALEDVDSL